MSPYCAVLEIEYRISEIPAFVYEINDELHLVKALRSKPSQVSSPPR